VCTVTPVHYEQTVRQEDAAGVCGYGARRCMRVTVGGVK
jgi:hypothetical protein